MPAGRPNKPTALKKLEGTFRKDRAVINEIMPANLEYIPSPPKFLDKDAKKEWKSVCQELIDLQMLHRVDLALLAAYCSEISNYINAVRKLRETGEVLTITRDDGSAYSMPSPWNAIKNTYLKNAREIASQFGFTPSARTKINGSKKGEEDPFDTMLNLDR
ncbi:phage terminase small subunit P27 family [Dyadobacter sp. CY261]|uniref:phage terminase small subunit P27 family n=1 Tax=Dyadobacter sp. CY261 TaxID=2907203 RepID=UPI001F45DE4F|nr:phage terminase small subunit P27 family [Dyadobacter sp. CY261]MCF0074470.1 phage terminase small subunit P27 family [Dyadobacter sp. CY261]